MHGVRPLVRDAVERLGRPHQLFERLGVLALGGEQFRPRGNPGSPAIDPSGPHPHPSAAPRRRPCGRWRTRPRFPDRSWFAGAARATANWSPRGISNPRPSAARTMPEAPRPAGAWPREHHPRPARSRTIAAGPGRARPRARRSPRSVLGNPRNSVPAVSDGAPARRAAAGCRWPFSIAQANKRSPIRREASSRATPSSRS